MKKNAFIIFIALTAFFLSASTSFARGSFYINAGYYGGGSQVNLGYTNTNYNNYGSYYGGYNSYNGAGYGTSYGYGSTGYGYALPYNAMPTYYPSYYSQSYYNMPTTPVSVYNSYQAYEPAYNGYRQYGILGCNAGYRVDPAGNFCTGSYTSYDGWGTIAQY